MAVPAIQHYLTEAEYLEFEQRAETKSEYFAGELFAMAGGIPNRTLIAMNVGGELRQQLKGGRGIAYNSDLKIKVEATGLITYPDVSVICGASSGN